MKEINDIKDSIRQDDKSFRNYPVILRPQSWWAGILWRPKVKKMKTENNIEDLLRALMHPKPKVRWAVMRALGELWDLPDLIKLGHNDPNIRAEAAEALGRLGDRRVTIPLIASLWDPTVVYYAEIRYYFPVRFKTILALGKIGDPIAIEPLIEAIRRRSWGYPAATYEVLYTSLTNFGQPMFDRLITLLQDEEQDMRELAAATLGYFDDPRAIQFLSEALKHENSRLLKGDMIQTLYRIGDERIIPVLSATLQHEEDPLIQWNIVRTLGRMPNPKVIPVLKSALQKASPEIRKEMISSLLTFGTPEARMAIKEYNESQNP